MKRILVIDDEAPMRHMLKLMLEMEGCLVGEAQNGLIGIEKLENGQFDLILCDVKMPVCNGLEFLSKHNKKKLLTPVIMMSAYGTIETAVEAMKHGAVDYISKPFKKTEIIAKIEKAVDLEELKAENLALRKSLTGVYKLEFKNSEMLKIIENIDSYATAKSSVLITGETGTGKEVLALYIHNLSRRKGAFIAVNCGAIPENLLESEMFGYVKGAFTDAITAKGGLISESDGGTLFLDEISDMPLPVQGKLLRVVEDGEVRPLGSTKSKRIDLRILSATSKNIEKEIEEDRFRKDLYYRLNTIQISIPPLRERLDDLKMMINKFIYEFSKGSGKRIKNIDDEALNSLIHYSWPGNIRELKNVIERAVILSRDNIITTDLFPDEIVKLSPKDTFSIKKKSEELEKELIKKALDAVNWNKSKAAKLLEISFKALLYKIKQYNIE